MINAADKILLVREAVGLRNDYQFGISALNNGLGNSLEAFET